MFEALHATGELLPQDRQGEIKPAKLTLLFDVETVQESSPFGDTVVFEQALKAVSKEYFLNGVQVTYTELEDRVKADYPHLDLDEELERLESVALIEYQS